MKDEANSDETVLVELVIFNFLSVYFVPAFIHFQTNE